MAKEKVIGIEELVQDDKNFNKGSEEGAQLIERSFRSYGAGRSVLVDKDNRLIAGNQATKGAKAAGIQKVRVIETDGTELIAVKRTDLDINSKEARELAFLDNRTTQVSLTFDEVVMKEVGADLGIDFEDLGYEFEDFGQVIESKGEVDVDEFEEEQELKLKFTPEQYSFVLDKLRQYGDNFSQSLLLILGYNGEQL